MVSEPAARSRVSGKIRPLRSPAAFLDADGGLAAIELALILPAAMLMLSLAVAGGQGFEIQRRVVLTTSTITGLVAGTPYLPNPSVSGATEMNQSDLDTDLALAAEVMYPQPSTNLTAVISELKVTASNNTGTVVWSEPYNGATALATGTVLALDPSLVASGAAYIIYGQVQYTYQPLSFMPSIASLTLSSSQSLVPRSASQITVNWGQ
jgi:Flp pilus assembly protein TadG